MLIWPLAFDLRSPKHLSGRIYHPIKRKALISQISSLPKTTLLESPGNLSEDEKIEIIQKGFQQKAEGEEILSKYTRI